MPTHRLEDLAEVATKVFIRRGYRRAQMAEVAEALGVAKGTLYLYVESKEALFDLVVRYNDSARPFEAPADLPLPTPEPGSTIELARSGLVARSAMPGLAGALADPKPKDPGIELDDIIREIYVTLFTNRTVIKLIDRVAAENPEWGDVWFKGGREGLLAMLARYISDRIESGVFKEVPDMLVTARVIIEMIAFWAVHRHWDPHPQEIDENVAEDTVVMFARRTLVKE